MSEATGTDPDPIPEETASGPGRPVIPRADLLADLRAVAEEIGHTPTVADYDDLGAYSTAVYHDRFESWLDALEIAGLDLDSKPTSAETRKIPREDLLADLRRVAAACGHPPTRTTYDEDGEHNPKTVAGRFESWDGALEAAGLDPERRPSHAEQLRIPREDLLDDLRAGAAALGRPPKSTEVDAFGDYSSSVYQQRFGSWPEALEAAGLDTGGDADE